LNSQEKRSSILEDKARGDLPALGLGVRLTTLQRKKINVFGKSKNSLGLGQILWINDPSDGILV
jgi:hypothetical protein